MEATYSRNTLHKDYNLLAKTSISHVFRLSLAGSEHLFGRFGGLWGEVIWRAVKVVEVNNLLEADSNIFGI